MRFTNASLHSLKVSECWVSTGGLWQGHGCMSPCVGDHVCPGQREGLTGQSLPSSDSLEKIRGLQCPCQVFPLSLAPPWTSPLTHSRCSQNTAAILASKLPYSQDSVWSKIKKGVKFLLRSDIQDSLRKTFLCIIIIYPNCPFYKMSSFTLERTVIFLFQNHLYLPLGNKEVDLIPGATLICNTV